MTPTNPIIPPSILTATAVTPTANTLATAVAAVINALAIVLNTDCTKPTIALNIIANSPTAACAMAAIIIKNIFIIIINLAVNHAFIPYCAPICTPCRATFCCCFFFFLSFLSLSSSSESLLSKALLSESLSDLPPESSEDLDPDDFDESPPFFLFDDSPSLASDSLDFSPFLDPFPESFFPSESTPSLSFASDVSFEFNLSEASFAPSDGCSDCISSGFTRGIAAFSMPSCCIAIYHQLL